MRQAGKAGPSCQRPAPVPDPLHPLVVRACASVNSYERLLPQHWSSAYACWGFDNREAAIRVPSSLWGHAIHACNTRFDEKVSYDPTSRVYGERITESERALRRCLALCGRVGNTHEIGEIYATYSRQMSQLFRGWKQTWSPSEETQRDLASAGALTDAYRFAARIASGSEERQDGTS